MRKYFYEVCKSNSFDSGFSNKKETLKYINKQKKIHRKAIYSMSIYKKIDSWYIVDYKIFRYTLKL